MKRIKAIIEKADDGGYGIYAEGEGIPLFSSGLTEQEAKDEFESLIHEQAKFIFAKSLDINPSLMRKYKSGIAKAGERQKDLIQRKFDDIVSRLSTVRF